ncbi:DUF2752 domain-containing protein [Feifania hominis]|uniref:DUF2752 domain-containing protein n=1 Tax=Feifania hominis TaxID=2763660 RepID=A0A926DFG5_9FIRM|nr:DUF2752 domain-containing protein [Feifania hominis]MBC8536055.1 DUF2752 domain-containing protein [Feifania hominis]
MLFTRKTLATHLVFLLLFAFLFWWGCPFNRLFGFTCPGCGLSRAWISFLRGDWRLAFKSHLLFLPAPVVVFLFAHRDTLFRRCQKTMDCIFIFFAVLLAAYHLLRG